MEGHQKLIFPKPNIILMERIEDTIPSYYESRSSDRCQNCSNIQLNYLNMRVFTYSEFRS